jgi:hypothetical protein
MLRPAGMTPSVSAYAYLWGQHDCNTNSFALLGCKVEAHITSGARETWAPHTASGYYVGNGWEHYPCHEVYISDTKSIRTCSTVLFKHKYLTMPYLTLSDALICATDNPADAISGLIPKSTITADAVNKLMEIYKQQARATRDAATAQRVLRECAQAERVIKEECQQDQAAPSPSFQVDDGNKIVPTQQATPQITQDKYDSSPAANTLQQCKIWTLTGFHAPIHGNPRIHGTIHTATGSFKKLPTTIPM